MLCLDRDNVEDGEKDQPDGEILFRKSPKVFLASIIGSATFGHPRQLPHASIGIKIR